MMFDGHIHIEEGKVERRLLEERMNAAGISGGVLLSLPPASFSPQSKAYSKEERLENLFSWVGDNSELFPFYWIDPIEVDALEQVACACRFGVKGFKIMCSRFFPGDIRALEVYKAIALQNKPILFHSGILWDGQPSSAYNRPAEFEPLMNIKGLRFALAHISWPWCDENIAVYGKIENARSSRPELSAEMYVDITPGTPPIYRKDALTKLLTVGYDIADNVIFGTDCRANNYNSRKAAEWITRDNEIYAGLELPKDILDRIYRKNLLRFIDGNKVL